MSPLRGSSRRPAVGLALAAGLLALAGTGARAETATIPFGNLVVTFDPADWAVTEREAGFDAACRATGCGQASVAARWVPGAADACEVEAALAGGGKDAPNARRSKVETLLVPGLTILVTWTDIGCRNLRPPVIRACTARAGRLYRLETGPGHCQGGPEPGLSDAVLRLLRGLATR